MGARIMACSLSEGFSVAATMRARSIGGACLPTHHAEYKTIEDAIGDTPLVRLQRVPGAAQAERGNVILAKLEGNNPAGSVKDRPGDQHDPRAPRSAARSSPATR